MSGLATHSWPDHPASFHRVRLHRTMTDAPSVLSPENVIPSASARDRWPRHFSPECWSVCWSWGLRGSGGGCSFGAARTRSLPTDAADLAGHPFDGKWEYDRSTEKTSRVRSLRSAETRNSATDAVLRLPAVCCKVEVEMIVMKSIGIWSKHGCEVTARPAVHRAQEPRLVIGSAPPPLHRDDAPVGECEGRDINGVRAPMLGELVA